MGAGTSNHCKFGFGDEVTVKGKVIYEYGNGDVDIEVENTAVGKEVLIGVSSEMVTLVKKAPPPVPRIGTVFEYGSITRETLVVADSTGSLRRLDGAYTVSYPIKWKFLDHRYVKVLSTS